MAQANKVLTGLMFGAMTNMSVQLGNSVYIHLLVIRGLMVNFPYVRQVIKYRFDIPKKYCLR